MKSVSFSILVLILTTLFCVSRNDPLHPRDNPCDAGGINYPWKFTATIYNQDGVHPSAGAVVNVFREWFIDEAPVLRDTTDENGMCTIVNLPAGRYTLFAKNGSFVLFQDSLVIDSAYSTLRDDTLECPASLQGSITIDPDYNPETVTVRLPGTGIKPVYIYSSGDFIVPGLASGTYLLLFSSSNQEYWAQEKTVIIQSCSYNVMKDTVNLEYKGIPFVGGIKISKDTVAGTVRLNWEKTVYDDFSDYVIFRDSCNSANSFQEPFHVTEDTIFIDTIPLPGIDHRCFSYRIAIRDIWDKIGPTKKLTEQMFFPKLGINTIAAGPYHSLFLKNNGALWVCGQNIFREPDENEVSLFRFATDVRKVAAGLHTMMIRNDGALWACGENRNGQLGDGTQENRAYPVKIMDDVKDIAAGVNHSMILKNDNSLWVCGLNDSGQLGDGTNVSRSIPVKVMDNVQSMAGGFSFSLFLKTDGTLWACGDNCFGQLGIGSTICTSIPVQVMNDVRSMAAGFYHSLIVKTDGTLWTCGANWIGQLGDGTEEDRTIPIMVLSEVLSVAAGDAHSLILRTDSTLWVCGIYSNGESSNVPVHSLYDVQRMAAGYGFSLILKNDNTLWACGANEYGQLGDGTTIHRPNIVRVFLPQE